MALSQAIKTGAVEDVMALLRNQRLDPTWVIEDLRPASPEPRLQAQTTREMSISWFEPPGADLLFKMFNKLVREYFYDYVRARDIGTLFTCLNHFRILCALRQGPWGVININRLIEYLLRRVGFIAKQEQWYARRPIIITKNDYNLKLFNGDIGILWQEQTEADRTNPANLRAFFPDPEKKEHFRTIPLQILPEHETVFAMTVHKSQGSEFDEVLLLLPFEDYPLITRELLYTAVTRTRQKLSVWGPESVIRKGTVRKLERLTGLQARLWP
jgi:exodeoxyribonuclease V alpha subunit